ncbi:VOC family protein [Chloroflexota bacterium]
MAKYAFDHIHLFSNDPKKTAEFYTENFGATEKGVREMGNGRITVMLDLDGMSLLISQPRDGAGATGLVHFGLKTDDLEKSVGSLKDGGVEFTQDITEVRPGMKISFFKAPEDVSVELMEGSL